MLGLGLAGVLPQRWALAQGGYILKLDFGVAVTTAIPVAPGYTKVLTGSNYSAGVGWGWVTGTGLAALTSRDRGGPSPILRDFIFATGPRAFRISGLTAGRRYRLTLVTGEKDFGNHTSRITISGTVTGTSGGLAGLEGGAKIAGIQPYTAQWATITGTLVTTGTSIDITFNKDATADPNWVINGLVLEEVVEYERPRVDMAPVGTSEWGPILTSFDPTAALLAGHKDRLAATPGFSFQPSGLTREDYLTLIASEVDFWKTKQNANGGIVDPYLGTEFQYSTPAYALSAATLVVYGGRTDLLETAALALDWTTMRLSLRLAASGHEDFYAPMHAHAIRLLKPLVSPERSAAWENYTLTFEPYLVYRYAPGAGNWNLVSTCGEILFQQMGLREPNHPWVSDSLARQGDIFDAEYGLYREAATPTAYDLFPRLWMSDVIAQGYNGVYSAEMAETMRRGAITSLFMQSSSGELGTGGRSSHHQWNEAQQCGVFEIYAAAALAAGDTDLAAYYKRAARISLASMKRWVRPTGEMQIVKNWIDPSQNFGYETYSSHSQYNLLAMAMLAMAYEHAGASEGVSELPAPADLGGYALQISALHKVFANASGTYIEIDTAGDPDYEATGFIRVHFAGQAPQLGPSDSVLAAPKYVTPASALHPASTGIGLGWLGTDNVWRTIGAVTASQITSTTVIPGTSTVGSVSFLVRYQGNFGGGVSTIEESFVVTPNNVQVTTALPGFSGVVRRMVPLLVDDGRSKSKVQVSGNQALVWRTGTYATAKHVFQMVGVSKVTLSEAQYPTRNGWVRLATADYPAGVGGSGVTLNIKTQPV
jgi:hypothetical protein